VTAPLSVQVDVAPGELIDKITILQIKSERISDADKLANIRAELETLVRSRADAVPASQDLDGLTAELKSINEKLWDIEDNIRDCERSDDFGPTFIDLARAVYRTNDVRADLKRQINALLGAAFSEEKSYAAY